MASVKIALSLVAAAFLVGCKSAPPAKPAVMVATSTTSPTTPAPANVDAMTDEQLVHANQTDGLGLGLKIPGLDQNRFPAGAPVPLHLLLEDIAARQPIASGMCTGFSLVALDVNTQDSQTHEFTNPRCFATVPYPDEIPFTKGKLKEADLTQRNASNMTLAPGTYSLTVVWKAVPAGKATLQEQPAYTTVRSNPVQITVTN